MFQSLSNFFSQTGGATKKRRNTKKRSRSSRKQRGGSCGCGGDAKITQSGSGCSVKNLKDTQRGGKRTKRTSKRTSKK
jgi:hypothetical protein